MIWIYDEAIAKDLQNSIDPSGGASDIVKVIDASQVLPLLAQMKEDKISFPLVCLVRHSDVPIDSARANFTRLHRGVTAVYDTETHNVYLEKAIPIKLEYDIVVLATNTVDLDEIVKEILFKYTSMYFITTEIPYESKRPVRFGVSIDPDAQISRNSASAEYIENGTLYQAVIPIRCDGAVLVSYTPKHIERAVLDTSIGIENPD